MNGFDLAHAAWRKSSYSANGGNCVEVAAGVVRKSGRKPGSVVMVRDSKDPQGPVLVFSLDEWRAFAAGVKAGEFDLG